MRGGSPNPFTGSGTIGVVCKLTGPDYLGVEVRREAVAIARRRIAAGR